MNNVKRCIICDIELDGWVYYEKKDVKICNFCYGDLEIRNND